MLNADVFSELHRAGGSVRRQSVDGKGRGRPPVSRNSAGLKPARAPAQPAPARMGDYGGATVPPYGGHMPPAANSQWPSPPGQFLQQAQSQVHHQQYQQHQQQYQPQQLPYGQPLLPAHAVQRHSNGDSPFEWQPQQTQPGRDLRPGEHAHAQQQGYTPYGNGMATGLPQPSAFVAAASRNGSMGDLRDYPAAALQTSPSLKRAGSGQTAGGRGNKGGARKRNADGSSTGQFSKQPKRQKKVISSSSPSCKLTTHASCQDAESDAFALATYTMIATCRCEPEKHGGDT